MARRRWWWRGSCGSSPGCHWHRRTGSPISDIESTLKTDLNRNRAVADTLGDQQGACQVQGQWLLAERRQAGILGPLDQVGMGIGLHTDHDSVQTGPKQGTDVGHGFALKLLGRCLCSGGIGIGHNDLLDAVQTLQCRRVHCADPTNTHEANSHGPTLPTIDSVAARQRARIR